MKKTIDIINEHIERIKDKEKAVWLEANKNKFVKEQVRDNQSFSANVDIYRKDVIKELITIKAELEQKIINHFKNISFDYTETSRDESLYGYDDSATFDITVYYFKEETDWMLENRINREFEKYWSERMSELVTINPEFSEFIIVKILDLYNDEDCVPIYKLYYKQTAVKNRDKYISRINGRVKSIEKISYICTLTNNDIFED